MLSVRRMQALHALATHGSIAAAADALSLTASAVSQHLTALELETGIALLERGPRSVRLTAAGEALVHHTEEVLARLAAAETEIRAIAGLKAGVLRLGCFTTAGAALLPAAVASFRAVHPEVALTLTEGEPDATLSALTRGDLDLTLVYEYDFANPAPQPYVKRVSVLADEILVVLPADHPLRDEPRVPVSALAGETWIAGHQRSWCDAFTERACRAAGFEPDIAFRTDDYAVACGLVEAGVGVAFVPRLAMRTSADVVARPPADGHPHRMIFAAHRVDAERSPAVADMVARLVHAAGELGERSMAAVEPR